MPPEGYGEKCHTLYFPSKEMLDSWKDLAHGARIPLTKWIIAIVEASLEQPSEETSVSQDIQVMRKENLRLRHELEATQRNLLARETELFKLRHRESLADNFDIDLDAPLIEVLRDGCVWSQRDLLEALNVDAQDSDAIAMISRLLQSLSDAGVLTEEKRGWKWKK